jgi:heat shock protein HtpX
MGFMKRIMLFMAVNVLVVVTISIVLNLLGVRPYMTSHGIDMQSLASSVWCGAWGDLLFHSPYPGSWRK